MTERTRRDERLVVQASILKAWGQEWRKANGKSQQELGRLAGYGSDTSPKSAAVAISRIESGKTDPAGQYRQRLLETLGHSEEDLLRATEAVLNQQPNKGVFARAMAGSGHLDNEVQRSQILEASNRLTQRVTYQIQNSETTFERARNEFILPFLEYAAKVDWQPVVNATDASTSRPGADTQGIQVRALRARTEINVLRTVGEAGTGSTPSIGAGAATAASVFARVAATAAAFTGSAIASRSGAAASSATLAWLSGASLTAGGIGIVGGTAALTGLASLPALLLLGGVLFWKGRKLRREADAEAEKLDAAQQALDEMEVAFERARKWNESQLAIIQRAGLIGRTLHSRYVEGLALNGPATADAQGLLTWDGLPDPVRNALETELKLVGIVLDTRALPVWLHVTAVGQPELTSSQMKTAVASAEWIDESLKVAEVDLDGYEGALRAQMAAESEQ